MIEFVMSKVWLVIGGLALAAVVLSAFTSLDRGLNATANTEAAEALTEIIEHMANEPDGEVLVHGRDLISGEAYMTIRDGSICVEDGSVRKVVRAAVGVSLLDDGSQVDEIKFGRQDALVIRSLASPSGIVVQLEKVDATAFTASTNLLHSSSLL